MCEHSLGHLSDWSSFCYVENVGEHIVFVHSLSLFHFVSASYFRKETGMLLLLCCLVHLVTTVQTIHQKFCITFSSVFRILHVRAKTYHFYLVAQRKKSAAHWAFMRIFQNESDKHDGIGLNRTFFLFAITTNVIWFDWIHPSIRQ